MSETTSHPLDSRLDDASERLRYWWRHNQDNQFWDREAQGFERRIAEAILAETYHKVGREHKIQLTAGEKAVQLFSFSKNPYDFLVIDAAPGDNSDLQPGESMDLIHLHQGLRNSLYHGEIPALYMGHVFHTHSIAMAQTLSLGGNLAVVPEDQDETHWPRYRGQPLS